MAVLPRPVPFIEIQRCWARCHFQRPGAHSILPQEETPAAAPFNLLILAFLTIAVFILPQPYRADVESLDKTSGQRLPAWVRHAAAFSRNPQSASVKSTDAANPMPKTQQTGTQDFVGAWR